MEWIDTSSGCVCVNEDNDIIWFSIDVVDPGSALEAYLSIVTNKDEMIIDCEVSLHIDEDRKCLVDRLKESAERYLASLKEM